MSDVLRFWCHEASNIRCVRESDFDRTVAEHQAHIARLEQSEKHMQETVRLSLRSGTRVAAERDALQQRLTTADQRIDGLEQALKFYAEREHYHFESGNWDTVSGEPLNILWNGDEPDFIEDGSVARSALNPTTENPQ